MVSEINFKNYSVEQLQKLKSKGVDVPDKAIKDAKKNDSQTKISDEESMKYEIVDDSSENNSAEKAAKKSEMKLKDLLETLKGECEDKTSDLDNYKNEIASLSTNTKKTAEEYKNISAEVDNINAELIDKKVKITERINKELESISENKAKIRELRKSNDENAQNEIEGLQEKINSSNTLINELSNDYSVTFKESNAEILTTKAVLRTLGTTFKDATSKIQQGMENAIDAETLAEEAVNKGRDATRLRMADTEKLSNAGFEATEGEWSTFDSAGQKAVNLGLNTITAGQMLDVKANSASNKISSVDKEYSALENDMAEIDQNDVKITKDLGVNIKEETQNINENQNTNVDKTNDEEVKNKLKKEPEKDM